MSGLRKLHYGAAITAICIFITIIRPVFSASPALPQNQPAAKPWETPRELVLFLAGKIQDPWNNIEAHYDVACADIAAGDKRRGTEVLKQMLARVDEMEESDGGIWGIDEKQGAYILVAWGLAHAGETEQAFNVVKKITDAWNKVITLREIASELSQSGNRSKAAAALKLAEHSASQIEDAHEKASALQEIAIAYAETGNSRQALELAESLLQTPPRTSKPRGRGSHSRREFHRKLWAALAALGAEAEAEAWAKRSPQSQPRKLSNEELALALVKAGNDKQAFEIVRMISDPQRKISLLLYLARAMHNAGRSKVSRQALTQAVDVARLVEDAPDRIESLREIAETMVGVGARTEALPVLQQAVEATQGIKKERTKERTLKKFAVELAEAGFKAEAVAAAQKIGRAEPRASALKEVERWSANRRSNERFLTSLGMIGAYVLSNSLLPTGGELLEISEAVNQHAAAGDHDRALQSSGQFKNAEDRVWARYQIGFALATESVPEQQESSSKRRMKRAFTPDEIIQARRIVEDIRGD